MIAASVKLSDLYRHLRIDAEFYKPEYLQIEFVLEKTGNIFPLRKYCHYIKKGIFDISPELYTDAGVPLIRTSEIKNPLINFATTVFLAPEIHQVHFKTELKPDDIVVTKIGAYIGDVALLPSKHSQYNFSQNVTGLSIKKKSINPKYLFGFLLSRFGHSQLTRIIMLSGQGKIELEDIRDISIFEASDFFQSTVANTIEEAQSFETNSEVRLLEAEELILSELGLTNWQPKHQLAFIKNYSDTEVTERIDAEYYQPKYEAIEEAIKKYSNGYSTIGAEFKQNKSTFKIDGNKIYEYVEIGSVNVSNGEISANEVIGDELPANAKRALNKNDVIVSKVRTYRGAITIVEESGYVGSGAFTVLRENGRINKETLLAFLHSKPLLAWSLKPNTGTSYPVIIDNDILNLPIPLIPVTKQTEIQQKVTESFSLTKQSKHLLECAKRAVEIAIEQNEQTAINWLKDQVEV
ncbi:restriction endonuclease subunit S [Saccharospirillum impatiens]|uniref:restriction endonuclease subunit S n=1 Tax=Saccharospirillum impatiens TaxID=169438 RepID=UPI000427593F|nr:restriction endonuclease subunit S [Saccharospirillum impatiens]